MTERLAHRFALYFERQQMIESEKRDLLEYGIFHILSSVLHVLFLLAAGMMFSAITEITAFCICFCTLKHYVGGAHANTHWGCLWGFTILATLSSVGIRYVYGIGLPPFTALIASIVALIIILLRAPVLHPNSPVYSAKKLKNFRHKAIITGCAQLAVICVCLLCGSTLSKLAICGAAGSLASSVSLLLPVTFRPKTP